MNIFFPLLTSGYDKNVDSFTSYIIVATDWLKVTLLSTVSHLFLQSSWLTNICFRNVERRLKSLSSDVLYRQQKAVMNDSWALSISPEIEGTYECSHALNDAEFSKTFRETREHEWHRTFGYQPKSTAFFLFFQTVNVLVGILEKNYNLCGWPRKLKIWLWRPLGYEILGFRCNFGVTEYENEYTIWPMMRPTK